MNLHEALAIATLAVAVANPQLAAAKEDKGYGIETISTRADRVSGGDVLVKITYKHDNRNHPLEITLNGRDIAGAFRPGGDPNTLVGLVTGLVEGKNALRVQGNGSSGIKDETLIITNYSIKGPIVSGPYVQPFICQTQNFRLPDGTMLGTPTDVDCSAPTKLNYVYMPVGGTALVPLANASTLPSDVAMTTSLNGATVPFVVRLETGTMDRGIYQNAVLFDPTSDPAPTPFTPPKGWNGLLLAQHGAGCPGGCTFKVPHKA